MADMERQMELFEEGGIADDGMSVDPVSGNEIPPGSLAEEVRDDIPAQLSEGEYVVPADVLRYYGVRFFEDLRAEAKQGLAQMDADGRIGGEPVPAGGPQIEEGDLTPEEIAVLQEMGMNVGGYVPQQQPPEAVGNTTMQMGTASAYDQGGLEDGVDRASITTPAFTPESLQKDYGLGFSIFGPSATESSTSAETTIVMLYSPDGQVRSLTLPTEQDEYDRLISEGWTTAQTEVTTEASVGREEPEGRDGGFEPSSEDTQEAASVSSMTNDQLSANAKAIGVIGNLGKVALGPVASTALGTVTAARYNDILDEMTFRGLDTTGMDRKGSIFGGEESLLGGLDDTNDDGKVDFGDTFLGDLLGLDGKFGVQGKSLKDSWKGGRRSGAPMDATGGANTTEGAQVGDTFGAEDLGGYTDSAGTEGGSDFGGGGEGAGNGDDGGFGDGMGIGGLYSKGGIVKRRSKKKK